MAQPPGKLTSALPNLAKSGKDSGLSHEFIAKQFKEFQRHYQTIDEIWKEIESHIESIEAYRSRSKKWKRRRFLLYFLIGILSSIIGGLIAYILLG